MYLSAVVLVLAKVGALAWPILVAAALLLFPKSAKDQSLRVAAGFVTIAWAISAWAFLIEPQLLVVKKVTVQSEQWSGPPVRIGVMADIHIGPHMSADRVQRLVARMNRLNPDIVVLPGDFVSGHFQAAERGGRENAAIAQGISALGEFTAPLGAAAVLGNHDWYYGGPSVEQGLLSVGVPVLENGSLRVERPDAPDFWIAGLADHGSWRRQPSWSEGLDAIPDTADVVMLAHRPDVFWNAMDRVALTIVGHSHCGQINLPIYGRHAISPSSKRWMCGLYEEHGRQLFVTGGVGVSILPVRFRVPPEIVVVTLEGVEDEGK